MILDEEGNLKINEIKTMKYKEINDTIYFKREAEIKKNIQNII